MKTAFLIGGGVLLATGIGLLIYQKYGGSNPASVNFDKLKVNLGNKLPDKDGVIAVSFNGSKNTAQFYDNGRVIIFEGTKRVGGGSYSDGGFTITMDGKAPIVSTSVYSNLLKTI